MKWILGNGMNRADRTQHLVVFDHRVTVGAVPLNSRDRSETLLVCSLRGLPTPRIGIVNLSANSSYCLQNKRESRKKKYGNERRPENKKKEGEQSIAIRLRHPPHATCLHYVNSQPGDQPTNPPTCRTRDVLGEDKQRRHGAARRH